MINNYRGLNKYYVLKNFTIFKVLKISIFTLLNCPILGQLDMVGRFLRPVRKSVSRKEKADEERWDSEKLRQKAANYGSKSGKDIYLGKKAEQNFKKDFDAYPAKNEREPGIYKSIQDKKRSIKETCLTILSVLDEI